MNDKTNGAKPVGYGHDKKGAAGGDTKVEGRPHVAHTGPADKVQGVGSGSETIAFTLDGVEVHARKDETIWQVAKRQGTDIPHLCYAPEPGYRPDGNCRACMVEIEGERVLAASCIRTPSPGMNVKSQSDRAKTARKMVFELLIADQPDRNTEAHDPASKFWAWADRMEIATSRLPTREREPAPDRSHVAMAVNLDACIQCNLCVRACREVQVNDVIGMARP
jgi:formate dehydrogenase major subunit